LITIAGSALAQQPWHGPYVPERKPAPTPAPAPRAAPSPPAPQPQRQLQAPKDGDPRLREALHVQLAQMIERKLANPEYAAALAARGRIPSSFHMPEEQGVRSARAALSKARQAPEGARVLAVPRARQAPTLDGRIYLEEWAGALQLPLQPAAGGTVLLLAHGGHLYLAAHAFADKTDAGYDQFRFWFHLDLSPYLRSERVFVAGKGWLAQLRGVVLPPGREQTDWNIFERMRGASRVEGYRQYELAIDMAEAGLFPGAPFPAFFEVEGDPVLDAAGQFKARTEVGRTGSAAAPVWLRISP
jgi:hypothetical protein